MGESILLFQPYQHFKTICINVDIPVNSIICPLVPVWNLLARHYTHGSC